MIDITKIQLHPIPLPIIELQRENKALRNILYAGGTIIGFVLAFKLITYLIEENERKNKTEHPRP